MTVGREQAALVALLRLRQRGWLEYGHLVQDAGSALAVLQRELGHDGRQTTLLPQDPGPLLERATAEIAQWRADGAELTTVLDDGYPGNLRGVDDRPPLLFVAGAVRPEDRRSLAVIGARKASHEGQTLARSFAVEFVRAGFTVISGLAAGVDTAAHEAALEHGGRTLAVIGTGLQHSYPPQNAALQRQIAERCAVISQFWPDAPPSRLSFPMRNAVMSGLSRGSVIVEASERSGARVQARLALAHGRPVFLLQRLLTQPWARQLASRVGVHVVASPAEVLDTLDGASTAGGRSEPNAPRSFRPTTQSPWPPCPS